MTTIADFLTSTWARGPGPLLESDPLRDVDILMESQILDVRICAVTSTVGLLLELRTALHFREANTALLVAHGVRKFAWAGERRSTSRTAWNVIGWVPRYEDLTFSLTVECIPNATLGLVSDDAQFYAGNVTDLGANPPDYGEDDDATIRGNLASWESELSAFRGSSIGLER